MFRLVSDRRGLAATLASRKAAGDLPQGLAWRCRPEAEAIELHTTGDPAAEQLAEEIQEHQGRRYWRRGRWRTEKKQLRLPGIA